MKEIAETTSTSIKRSEETGKWALDLLERVLNATQNVTGPQAALLVGGTAAIVGGGCFIVGKISETAGKLIVSGYVKEVDLQNRRVAFTDSSQCAA